MVATSSRLLVLLLAFAIPLFAAQGETYPQRGEERLRELRSRMEQETRQAAALRARLEAQEVNSVAAWQQRSQDLAEYRRRLTALQQLRSDFQAAGGSISADEAGSLQADLAWCDAALGALESDRPRLALMQLDEDYRALQRERRRLQNEYMRAYGTSQARIALQNMRALLLRMRDNRLAALRAGNNAAAAELAQLERDLQRLR